MSAFPTMIEISKALKLIERQVAPLKSERVPLADAVGRVLAEDVVADIDMPPFDRSQMDGYAVSADDTTNAPVGLRLAGEAAAGRGWHKTLKPGEAVRIMTGAPVPKGSDAVQKVELTRETSRGVEILEPTEKGRFIVTRGSEIRRGKVVVKRGEVVSDNMIATLAAFGYARVKVSSQPRVAVFSTGSEIVEVGKKPGRDQIRNSNSVMLDILCRRHGAVTSVLPIVEDDPDRLKQTIKTAAASTDVVVITGGVSVGKYDHTKPALVELGADLFFDKVRLKPGKPAVFARLGKTLIFALPGNPVSAAVTFHLFVRKCLMMSQSALTSGLRKGNAVIAADVRAARERATYLPARCETNKQGVLVAKPLKWHGSSDFIGFARADALVVLPRGASLARGDVADIRFL